METFNDSIHKVYENREKFIVIGLTGRTGSGCSTVASILSSDLEEINFPKPDRCNIIKDEERKYRISNRYILQNWKAFHLIRVSDVITSFILENDFKVFVSYVSKITALKTDKIEKYLEPIKSRYVELHELRIKLKHLREKLENSRMKDGWEIIKRRGMSHKFYFHTLHEFSKIFKETLNTISENSYTTIYQKIGDNIRSSGEALQEEYRPENIYRFAIRVNKLIKIFTNRSRKTGKDVYVVIDAIRNPFEALFFRERYAAFYLLAINTPDNDRKLRLQRHFNLNLKQIEELDQKEESKKKGKQIFISQNIPKCYELADAHINNPQKGEEDLTIVKKQIAKFVSLIMHPGLITPSKVEKCMQIAHVTKLNSGCLSRQVGAVITDENFAIKAVGRNTSPKGQTSCMLRNVEDFLNHEDETSFSDYERNTRKFRKYVADKYKKKLNCDDLKGRNICYCFKDIYNDLEKKDNQVHTRALHAEENAFLQITKYGGMGITGGMLFTTSSPCELCSKKAYQLGMKKIFYIDPYPGRANDHILDSGTQKPKLILFSGAVGRAYHQLYDPILPYKDELSLLMGIEFIKPSYGELARKNNELEKENRTLQLQLQELEK